MSRRSHSKSHGVTKSHSNGFPLELPRRFAQFRRPLRAFFAVVAPCKSIFYIIGRLLNTNAVQVGMRARPSTDSCVRIIALLFQCKQCASEQRDRAAGLISASQRGICVLLSPATTTTAAAARFA